MNAPQAASQQHTPTLSDTAVDVDHVSKIYRGDDEVSG